MSVVADQAGSSGDQTTAMLIALEALGPDGGEGMHSPAAAASLYQAWLNNRETTLAGHTKAVYTAQFSPDGRHVVTAAADGTARVWDVSRPHPTAIVLAGHREAVYGAAFDRDGNHVVTASLDGTARVWDLSTTPPTSRELKGHTDFGAIRGIQSRRPPRRDYVHRPDRPRLGYLRSAADLDCAALAPGKCPRRRL